MGSSGRDLSRTPRLAAIATALGLACVATPKPRFLSGETDRSTGTGLQRLEFSGFQRAWLRPDVSFSRYDQVWLRRSEITYREEPEHERGRQHGSASGNYALSNSLYDRLGRQTLEVFERELGGHGLRVARAAGPSVLDVRVGLLDLVVRWPLNQVDGQNPLYVDSLGSVVLVIDLHDSESGALIARLAEFDEIASDSLRPLEATAGTAIYETRRLMRSWATRLRALLQSLQAEAPS